MPFVERPGGGANPIVASFAVSQPGVATEFVTPLTFSISSDMPGGAVNSEVLEQEIRDSAIGTGFFSARVDGDVLSLLFDVLPLPGGDKTILDADTSGPAGGLLAAHDNLASAPTDPSINVEKSIWRFDTGTSDADPGEKKFRMDNATQGSATFLFINDTPLSENAAVVEAILDSIEASNRIYLQNPEDSSKFHLVKVTGATISASGYTKIPITVEVSGSSFAADDPVVAALLFSGVGAREFHGFYTGDGTLSQLIEGIPFEPDDVEIFVGQTVDNAAIESFRTTTQIMSNNANGGAISHIGSQHRFMTNAIIALGPGGSFTVDDDGSDDHPNQLGQLYNFTARQDG